jgi:NAD(P)-dependent dehydrogenase (short-subunit alcohol dehydrogenase family)
MHDKVSLVTGCASRIGAETAPLLADDGAAVLVCDLDAEAAASTAARSSSNRRPRRFAWDVADLKTTPRSRPLQVARGGLRRLGELRSI